MIHTTYYPSQSRFPHLCSHSDRFRSPGLIYVSIHHGLCLSHSGFLRSRNHCSRRFSQTQNSMTHEALVHTIFQSLNGPTSAAHPLSPTKKKRKHILIGETVVSRAGSTLNCFPPSRLLLKCGHRGQSWHTYLRPPD